MIPKAKKRRHLGTKTYEAHCQRGSRFVPDLFFRHVLYYSFIAINCINVLCPILITNLRKLEFEHGLIVVAQPRTGAF